MGVLTQERLNSVLRYDPDTGEFFWRQSGIGRRAHLRAGYVNLALGYLLIWFDGKKYYAHRLAWLLMTGAWPQHGIDHKDGNKTNNRFCNLRQATQTLNQANQKRHKNNRSGYKGVVKNGKSMTWSARISAHGKHHYLGSFSSPQEAHESYCTAAKKHFGEFANFGRD